MIPSQDLVCNFNGVAMVVPDIFADFFAAVAKIIYKRVVARFQAGYESIRNGRGTECKARFHFIKIYLFLDFSHQK